MIRPSFVALVLAFAMLPSGATGSTPGQGPRPWAAGEPDASPVSVTKTMNCRIAEIAENRTLVLYDHGTEQEYVVEIPPDISLRSRAKKLFDGRKQLAFADLEVGHVLKVTYSASDGSLRRIRVVGHEQPTVATAMIKPRPGR